MHAVSGRNIPDNRYGDFVMTRLKACKVVIAALALATSSAQAATFQFVANLSGANQVPANTSAASGSAYLTFDDSTNSITQLIFGAGGLAASVTGAHIHEGPAGSNGPVVFDFADDILQAMQGDGSWTAAAFTQSGPGALDLTDLLAGGYYVNIHNAVFPGGEIRGQLLQVTAVPEPGTWAMLAAGLGLVGLIARRRV